MRAAAFPSYPPRAEEQHFLLLSLCPKEGKGRRAALGRRPGEQIGQCELAACLHLSLRGAGSGAEPGVVQAGSQRKGVISSRPCSTIRSVYTGCLVSYRSCPEVLGMGRRRDRLCGFFQSDGFAASFFCLQASLCMRHTVRQAVVLCSSTSCVCRGVGCQLFV